MSEEPGPREDVHWPVVVVAVAISIVVVLPVFMTGALAVQITADLGIDLAGLGLLIGVYFGASALGSAALGRLAESRGWPGVLRGSTFGSAITLIGVASIARSAWVVAAFFVLGGLCTAAAQPAANLALARSVPPQRYGLLFGLKHVAAPFATMLGGLAVPAFGLTVGWRWAYVVAAGLAVTAALAVPRRGGKSAGLALQRLRRARLSTPVRTLVILAIAAALGIAGMDSLASFIVTYAVDSGVSESTAGLLLALGSTGGIVARLLAGWLIDRRQHAGLLGIAGLLGAGSLGLAVVAVGGRGWLVAGTLLAFTGGWGWSGLMTFAVVRANPDAPAAATGITHTGTFVGAAVGPPLFGLAAEHVSFATAWWIATAAVALAAALVLFVHAGSRGAAGMAAGSGPGGQSGRGE
jgi:predicted MFS family arabinose efflux permease